MKKDVSDKVKKMVADHLGVEEAKVTEEANFIDDLGADSLDTVELVMAFEDKFGIEWTKISQSFSEAMKLEYVEPIGLAIHIGSQLTDLLPFRKAFLRLHDVAVKLIDEGYSILSLDVGGGLGISYDGSSTPNLGEYIQLVNETLGDLGCDILFEPGRIIVGNAGILVTKVIHVKNIAHKQFLIVSNNIRNSLGTSVSIILRTIW